jgi:hypothetical protein
MRSSKRLGHALHHLGSRQVSRLSNLHVYGTDAVACNVVLVISVMLLLLLQQLKDSVIEVHHAAPPDFILQILCFHIIQNASHL